MRRLLYPLLIMALLVQPGSSAWLIRPASAPAPADFPVVAATNTSNDQDGADPRPIAFGETPPDGDLLLVLVSGDSGNGAWGWPAGWTELFDDPGSLNQPRCAAAYKIASGESTSIDATYSAAFDTSHQYYRITGFDSATAPEASAMVEGTSTAPNPGSLTPSWGAANTLWLAFACSDGPANAATAIPTNYTDLVEDAVSGVSNNTHSARRDLNATSDDPGAFTITNSEQWHAYTLAIRPTTAGGAGVVASDDFNGSADGTALSTHDPNWTVHASGYELLTNQLRGTTSGAQALAYYDATYADDQYAQVTITDAGSHSIYLGVAVRVQTGSASGYDCIADDDFVALREWTAGTPADLNTASRTQVNGDVLRLEASDTSLSCLINDVEIVSATDATYASGKAGLGGRSGDPNSLMDNWEGGNN